MEEILFNNLCLQLHCGSTFLQNIELKVDDRATGGIEGANTTLKVMPLFCCAFIENDEKFRQRKSVRNIASKFVPQKRKLD